MKAYLVKAFLSAGDWVGRTLVFNRNPPPVGRLIRDLRYGRDRKQRIDVVVPRGRGGRLPILIFVHGGGWLSGDKAVYTRNCRCFASRGYLVFNVNYRLAPRHRFPLPVLDVAAGIRWARDHAAAYGGDCSTIFLAGDSAGAQLTSWYVAALHKPELLKAVGIRRAIDPEAVLGLLFLYGIFDCRTFAGSQLPCAKIVTESFLGKDPETFAERADLISPIRHVTKTLPPTFLCAGEPDPIFDQSVAMAAALRKHGAPHETLFFSKAKHPDARHAFLNFPDRTCAAIARREAIRFLDDLRPTRSAE